MISPLLGLGLGRDIEEEELRNKPNRLINKLYLGEVSIDKI
jgi:hypothetical protein